MLEEHRDDFRLDSDTREAPLVEVYKMVGRLPDYAAGLEIEPMPFCRWLSGHWDSNRVRALALGMEAMIREKVPEPLASGETWFH